MAERSVSDWCYHHSNSITQNRVQLWKSGVNYRRRGSISEAVTTKANGWKSHGGSVRESSRPIGDESQWHVTLAVVPWVAYYVWRLSVGFLRRRTECGCPRRHNVSAQIVRSPRRQVPLQTGSGGCAGSCTNLSLWGRKDALAVGFWGSGHKGARWTLRPLRSTLRNYRLSSHVRSYRLLHSL